MELWKDVLGYEGLYKISNFGRVKSIARIDNNNHPQGGKELKLKQEKNRYMKVNLSKNGKAKQHSVHRLVAIAFLDKPKGCNIVNHLDNDPSNNNYSNLEWTTHKGNMQHAAMQGRMTWKPENLKKAQESHEKPVIGTPINQKSSNNVLEFKSSADASRNGFDRNGVSRCCNGTQKTSGNYTWRYKDE